MLWFSAQANSFEAKHLWNKTSSFMRKFVSLNFDEILMKQTLKSFQIFHAMMSLWVHIEQLIENQIEWQWILSIN